MSFNLVREAWIPARRADGARTMLAPWQVASGNGSNPFIALDAPRPDFNGALIQFLIGLVQTALAPRDDRAWRQWLTQPPGEAALKAGMEPVAHAFDLDGDGPRFMQDRNLTADGAEMIGVEKLLIDTPGAKTQRDDTDHFIKRGRIPGMCRPCCAAALFALQTNAPSGGVGHRTSLRGGGPLSTIVLGQSLWQTIWLNVLSRPDFLGLCGNPDKSADGDRFPWLVPARTSENGLETGPLDVHPAHMFWAMPRRIRLDFDSPMPGPCGVCGHRVDSLAVRCASKNYGNNYKGAWRHPLTPYHGTAQAGETLSVKCQAGASQYRHWIGLVHQDSEEGLQPSRVVHEFWQRQFQWPELHEVLRRAPRLWACGYDMDKAKARNWCEGVMPLLSIDAAIRTEFENVARRLVAAAMLTAENLLRAIQLGLYGKVHSVHGNTVRWRKLPEHVKRDKTLFEDASDRFWLRTEIDFYGSLARTREALLQNEDITTIKESWAKELFDTGKEIFDELSQCDQIGASDPKRIALARRDLLRFNSLRSPRIRELLDLPIEEAAEGPASGREAA